MKKLIVTIAIGDFHKKLGRLTHPFMKKYAEKIGADFEVIEDQGEHTLPHYRKLDLGDYLNKYDRVCYIDTDIIVRPDSPDIFEIVPYNKFGAFEEGSFADRAPALHTVFEAYAFECPTDIQADYWNTGVMVFSKPHQPIFCSPKIEVPSFYEQSYLNLMFHALQVQMANLSYRFNSMKLVEPHSGEDRLSSFFIHYAGYKDIDGEEALLSIVKGDIKRLKEAAPNYRFKRKFLIAVQGGIGDQISAEPAIRYLMEVLYPGDEFHLATYWPEIFSHLDCPKYTRCEDVPGYPNIYAFQSYREATDDSWRYISQGAMHITEFCALMLFKHGLPEGRKRIKLEFSQEDYESMREKLGLASFQKTVIFHPGRGWPSKTFPADVWLSYIEAAIMDGYRPIILGKDNPESPQGIVAFDLPAGCVDARNVLTMKEMFALVASCPVLISNESGPVQVAGAFNNWIGLICTGKRPEYVLPYRGPVASPFWRARALEREKRYDEFQVRPTNVEPVHMDYLPPGKDVRDYCPTVETVRAFIGSASSNAVIDYLNT